MESPRCRFCNASLKTSFVDLGMSPLSNAYLKPEQLNLKESFYPLHAYVCDSCFLVQLEKFESPEHIFGDYAYFSSYSDSWLEHCKNYTEMIIPKLNLNGQSLVVELASNDGYLLQYFKTANIPVLGIEPAGNVAEVAQAKGIDTVVDFFGVNLAQKLAAERGQADLIVANNVLAHVPDLNDFVAGMKLLLKSDGIITIEFPHLLQLIRHNQFDTIYHEHFSYFSLTAAAKVFAHHGLSLFEVEELPTHGGSLRIYICHADNKVRQVTAKVTELLQLEEKYGLKRPETYRAFEEQVKQTKRDVLKFLIQAKQERKTIAGYGAPAKGNTLLNYCSIRTDFLDYTVDRSPHKQGLYLPGTHIPIFAPEKIRETKPDYLFVLPWNLKDEIMEQMSYIREWGGKFVIPIPKVTVK